MRRNLFPPRPRADDVRTREMPTRKVFNCIADDSALMAGVKKSTRDGIRKWVTQGAIRLFVPLHTLTHLNHLKKGTDRAASDAREALKWLDDITSDEDATQVQLQGVDEEYETWGEVEKFLLPQTLLSMEDTESEEDDEEFTEDLENSFNHLEVSDGTSVSSSHSLDEPLKSPHSQKTTSSANSSKLANGSPHAKANSPIASSPDRTARNSADISRAGKSPKSATKTAAPANLQPLFNHILWRINKETNPEAALMSYIFLTNDPAKQTIAQKFGVRAKRLEQLRDAVAREEREYKNRLTVYKLESEGPKPRALAEKTNTERPKSIEVKEDVDSDDEDVVLLRRAPRGPQAQTANAQRVLDPNDFGRANNPHHGGRGGRGGHGPIRGHGGPIRGRGTFAPRGGAYQPPGSAPQHRAPPVARVDPNAPIDPNSFIRPTPRANPARGTRRKLWEPN